MRAKRFLIAAMAGISCAFLSTANAQDAGEPVILKVEHFMPAGATANAELVVPWCNRLEEASKGRLKCEVYPSMQLGGKPAQLPQLLRNNVIDVIFTAYGYTAGGFPRSEVMELPFSVPQDMYVANEILWEFMNTYGSEDVKDFKLLGVFSDGGGAFHTSKKQIASLGDLSGMRMRASTRMTSKFLQSLDAAPVSMPPSQISDAVSKGVIDGVLGVWELLPPTKLDETTFFHTESGPDQAATAITPLTMMMNKERYESLPDDLKAIVDEYSGPALNRLDADAYTAATKKARDKTLASSEHTVITMDDAFYRAMKEKSSTVTAEWLDGPEISGVDRAELLKGFQDIVRKHAPDLK